MLHEHARPGGIVEVRAAAARNMIASRRLLDNHTAHGARAKVERLGPNVRRGREMIDGDENSLFQKHFLKTNTENLANTLSQFLFLFYTRKTKMAVHVPMIAVGCYELNLCAVTVRT